MRLLLLVQEMLDARDAVRIHSRLADIAARLSGQKGRMVVRYDVTTRLHSRKGAPPALPLALVVGMISALAQPMSGQLVSPLNEAATIPLPPLAVEEKTAPADPLGVSALPAIRFGLGVECSACPSESGGSLRPSISAPWSTRVATRFSIGGTELGVALLGSNNYRLPRYMAQPLGIDGDTTPPGAPSYADLSSSRTEWTVSARVSRTLKTFGGGRSLGLTSDAWLPLNSSIDPQRRRPSSVPPYVPGVPLLSSKTIRVGLTFRF